VVWLGTAAPITAPPTKPTTATASAAWPLVQKHDLGAATAPTPAPTPAPTKPKINALRKRWLLPNAVTRITFSRLMVSAGMPSRISMDSSETLENVPVCFLSVVSTTSTFSPARRRFRLPQDAGFVCAGEQVGSPRTNAVISSFRIVLARTIRLPLIHRRYVRALATASLHKQSSDSENNYPEFPIWTSRARIVCLS
jgi:hypothetical protein